MEVKIAYGNSSSQRNIIIEYDKSTSAYDCVKFSSNSHWRISSQTCAYFFDLLRWSKKLFKIACRISSAIQIQRVVSTVLVIANRHKGHILTLGAHSWQVTRWPQGRNTVLTMWSMQILQVRSSFSWRFNSFNVSSGKEQKNTFTWKTEIWTENGKLWEKNTFPCYCAL